MAATLPSRRPPHKKSLSPQRVVQYDPYAHQLGSLSESIHRLLTERECAIYDRALTDYHRRRHIRAFVECLSLVLNTNQKRQLLIPIRDSYIKPSDLQKFNQLALEFGLATPLKKRKSDTKDGVRKIEIKRNPDGEWGFNIRGGSEHGIGIFVSSVERGSNAEKGGLKAGDQIKKANDLNCESVTHQEAVTMMRNCKKLQLWVLSRGHVPTSRMAHKVYNWVDPQGRPASPPPDPFEVQEQISSSSRQVMNQPDERKVTMMIENGQDLGISIRGGAEHGLGIYISAVEEGSVAEAYGVNVGDQILEVNGISFLGIVHSDAAHALRAQPCMVMKLKDVGKLPHSRVTTLGKTQWHTTGGSRTLPQKGSRSPVFTPGYGTQVMLSDQENSFQVRGMMDEVARSVLSPQELNTFNYYVDQYDQKALSIDDLVTPMLHLLNTPEKLQLLSEMHVVIKPRDLQRFNELTVHKALAVKKAGMYHGHPGESHETGGAPMPTFKQHSTPKSKAGPVKRNVVAQVHAEERSNNYQVNPFENEDHTLTHDDSSEEGGRDKVPQKLSPTRLMFHPPPPPSSAPSHSHSAPNGDTKEDTWSAAWNETSMMSPPPKGGSSSGADSSINVSEIESRVRTETEERLRKQFEEQQKKLIDEQTRKMKEETAELEEKIRREAEESMKKQLREKEEALARMSHKNQEKAEDKAHLEEEIKRELEEKIWKEAEEHLRIELEKKMQRELESAKSEREETDYGANARVNEDEIRQEIEQKFKREYEEKIRREQEKWKRKEEEERRKQQQEAKQRQEEEVARLEAEEQARIELEDRIRREAEASARAEYEARLQHETEERARLAEEVKARKAMEERMEKERVEREKKERKREQQREWEREQERKQKERELASARSAAARKQEEQKAELTRDAAEEEEGDSSEEEEEETTPGQMTAEEQEEQRMLEIQRRKRLQEQKEEQRREEAQRRALAAEKAKKDEELAKKRELARKREENIRKMEEERKQKEAVTRQRREEERKKKLEQEEKEKQSTIERERQVQSKKKQEEEAKRQRDRAEAERIRKQKEQEQQNKSDQLTKMGGRQVMVSGAARNGTVPTKKQALSPKSKAAAVEDERNKAEELLEKRLREKREAAAKSGPTFSYAGYSDLRGELKHVLITKVVRKLGIAIDGGANTKQKAVIIREISPEGCAGQTAPDLKVNQQLLEIEGQTLHGLKHKDVVMSIKHAFEGELGKVIDFTVVEPYE